MKNTDQPKNFTPEELYAVGIDARSVTHALAWIAKQHFPNGAVLRNEEDVSFSSSGPIYFYVSEPWHFWANLSQPQIIEHIQTEIAIQNVTRASQPEEKWDIFSVVRIQPCAQPKPKP